MSEKQALKNLFKKPETNTSVGVITDVLSKRMVEILDQAGRYKIAEVDIGTFYPKGVSVVVKNGRVVRSSIAQKIKRVMV